MRNKKDDVDAEPRPMGSLFHDWEGPTVGTVPDKNINASSSDTRPMGSLFHGSEELTIGPGGNNYGEGFPDPAPLTEEELKDLRRNTDRAKIREALGGNIRRITAKDMNIVIGPARKSLKDRNILKTVEDALEGG